MMRLTLSGVAGKHEDSVDHKYTVSLQSGIRFSDTFHPRKRAVHFVDGSHLTITELLRDRCCCSR